MLRTVWVEAWEQACCGEPFALGSEVTWRLAPAHEGLAQIFRAEDGIVVDAVESHHGGDLPDDAPSTSGTVETIRLVHITYGPRPHDGGNVIGPLPASARITSVIRPSAEATSQRGFAGFLVELRT